MDLPKNLESPMDSKKNQRGNTEDYRKRTRVAGHDKTQENSIPGTCVMHRKIPFAPTDNRRKNRGKKGFGQKEDVVAPEHQTLDRIKDKIKTTGELIHTTRDKEKWSEVIANIH